MVTFAGTVTIGAVVSRTVTLNDADAMLPRPSAAEQATVVVPNGKVSPLAGTQSTATSPYYVVEG